VDWWLGPCGSRCEDGRAPGHSDLDHQQQNKDRDCPDRDVPKKINNNRADSHSLIVQPQLAERDITSVLVPLCAPFPSKQLYLDRC
jgi:hypothetical protein